MARDLNRKLHSATVAGSKDEVLKLLDDGANVNFVDKARGSVFAIATAAYRGYEEIVSIFLDRGADVNMRIGGKYGSALASAAYANKSSIVSLLLDHGADINMQGGEHGSALATAASQGHIDIVSLLLDRGADINITGEQFKYGSALATAAYWGHEDIILLLLDRGADINLVTVGKYGSALASAAYENKTHIVSLLLDRGADINLTGGEYGSALASATYNGHREVVSLLLDRKADINSKGEKFKYGSALATAAYWGHESIVSVLLEAGADVNLIVDPYGTALATAAYNGHADVVLLLLDARADVNLSAGKYGSALATATCGGPGYMQDTIPLLLQRGANINMTGGECGSALATAACFANINVVSLLVSNGAAINLTAGRYGTALAAAAYRGRAEIVSLLLELGADANTIGGEYGTALGAAAYQGGTKVEKVMRVLLEKGADISLVGGPFGTALGAAIAGAVKTKPPNTQAIEILLDQGADINMVYSRYGSPLGNAVHNDNEDLVSFLLTHGADPFHVGGEYETKGNYPTIRDIIAQSTIVGPGIHKLLSHAMSNLSCDRDNSPWPPFPMPYVGSYVPRLRSDLVVDLEVAAIWDGGIFDNEGRASDNRYITVEEADLPCTAFDEETLMEVLVARVGINAKAAERHRVWMQNDIRYFISHKYDLGLACAAARVGWEGFQNLCPDIVAIHRHQWLEKARQIDEMRQNAIYTNETGQEIIRSPYQIMPRRIWDLQCNRVVQFRMLHSKASAHEIKSKAGSMRTDDVATTCPTFWAITHSWTKSMEGVDTTINQLEWPVPLPHNLGLATLRKDLIAFGAEYVWLDVLCLRQQGNSESDLLRKDEWKLDVPTIGNIYRAATAIIRYFNGLGQPFRHEGWDDQRHWLQRAWTLQEIKTANTTFNAGLPSDGNQISLNTKGVLDGEIVTLRQAISRVVKLATQIDSASGCNIYDLVKEMSKRYATQSTDRVSGLLYLLRIIQLPTYNAGIDHEAAWTQCFHVLPFERKLEILLDFPNRASGKISKDQLTISGRWFPTWTQLMNWPDRNPIYDHTSAALPQNERRLQLMEPATRDSFFVPDIFAISHAWLDDLSEDKYKVKAGSKSFIFYYPYVIRNQEPVFNKASQFQPFTLVTSHPDEPYNWVVCEILEKRKMMCRKTGEKPLDEVEVEVEVLRKVGVLRTDSCTELYLNVEKSDSILKKINALFE